MKLDEFLGFGNKKPTESNLDMARVHVARLDDKIFPEIKGEVFTIRNESPIIDALIDMLGIPRDGTSYKIRTGFMAYDEKRKILFFSKNKYDLPSYLEKRPANYMADKKPAEATA